MSPIRRTILIALAVTAASAGVAQAGAPITERWSEPYADSFDCGDFVNEYAGTEHISWSEIYDGGDLVRIVLKIRFSEVDTNVETGKSVVLRGSSTEVYDLAAGTRTVTGAVYIGTKRGGTYIQDTGRIVLDLETDEILDMAGPHEGKLLGVDPLVCAALAS